MTIWPIILIVALLTLLERASFILFLSRWEMPAWFVRALRYVPAAVFPALVAPLFLQTNGQLDLSLINPKLLAGIVALLVAWRTNSLLGTILAGMGMLWFVTWML